MNATFAAFVRVTLIGGALGATLFVAAKMTRFQIVPAGHENRSALKLDRWTGQTWRLSYTKPLMWEPIWQFEPDAYLGLGTPEAPTNHNALGDRKATP